MTKEIKLKHCPHCGGEAKLTDLTQAPEAWVECTECGARTRFFSNSEEGAVSAWNSRPIEDDLNEQIGRFKKYAAALEKEVKTLRAALETILDASQQDDPCILGVRVVAYEALKEDKHSD